MTFPVIEEEDELEELVDPMRDWLRLNATRKIRDQLISQRESTLDELIGCCTRSSDPRAAGLAFRLRTLDETVMTMGGRGLSEEIRHVQKTSDSRE